MDRLDKVKELRVSVTIALAHLEAALRGFDGKRSDGDAGALQRALLAQLQDSDDIVFRRFRLGASGMGAMAVYADGLVNKEDLEERVIAPLILSPAPADGTLAADLVERAITAAEVKTTGELDEAMGSVLAGKTVLLLEGCPEAVIVSNPGAKERGVEKPAIEFALKGPRDSFSESLITNTALIRRRLRDPGLRIQKLRIGRRTRTDVALIYLEGVANPEIVQEARRRLERIDIDGILDSGYIEQLIEDTQWSPFPTVNGSERPDVVVAGLLEGRVAILVDNSSFALIVPATFDGLFHSPEDSYDRWLPVSLLRVVRFIASFAALLTPSLYVAMASYHPGLMPLKLAVKVAGSREGVAFPVVFEALLAQFSLELLKEASFRIPSPVGQVFGVVGGLVLGDLGVRAGIFSEIMMIVIAITAIASFSIPTVPLGTVVRLLGLPVMLATAFLGLFGMVLTLLAILAHLAVLRSFGVPYLVPYAFFSAQDLKDTIPKFPLATYRGRPTFFRPRVTVMQKPLKQGVNQG